MMPEGRHGKNEMQKEVPKSKRNRLAWAFAAFILALFVAPHLSAQTVSPFMGIGNVQFLDNNGKPLSIGYLYSFQAGTTTQQATYTDATGLVQNQNPIPLSTGGRASIWLSNGAFYKFVLCSQNDGSSCASGDILFTADQVPGSPVVSNSGSTFT